VNGYRLLLRLAPRHLRIKHAGEMEALFRQRLAEARERGRVAALIVWLRAARDVATAFLPDGAGDGASVAALASPQKGVRS
jgi:hypothetical protein